MPDGVELAPSSLADLRKLGDAYKGGDKILQKRLRNGLKEAGKPLGDYVLREGSQGLPRAGGLQARILASRAVVTASLAARNPSVYIRLVNRQKDSIGGLNSGYFRHPVFGEKRLKLSSDGSLGSAWVSQESGVKDDYTAAFNREAPKVRDQVNAEIAKALTEIAREAD